jgi:hypothetical protein
MEDSNKQEVVVNWLFELLEERRREPISVSVVTSNYLVSFLVLLLHPLSQESAKEYFVLVFIVNICFLFGVFRLSNTVLRKGGVVQTFLYHLGRSLIPFF